jgi:dihydropteroate synthase type 2
VRVLAGLGRLKQEFGLPGPVSVSRKSFLRSITGSPAASEVGPATLAALRRSGGSRYLRTHDPAALRDGLQIVSALHTAALTY